MGKKLLGVILLIGGIVVVVFGVSYNNSVQHQMSSMVNSFIGGPTDSSGTIAIVVGAIIAIIGAALLVIGGSSGNKASS